MLVTVLSVYDSRTETYGPPMFVRHVNEGVRWFQDEVAGKNDPASRFAKHPEDFRLCQLGFFDDTAGRLEGDSVRVVLHGADLPQGGPEGAPLGAADGRRQA